MRNKANWKASICESIGHIRVLAAAGSTIGTAYFSIRTRLSALKTDGALRRWISRGKPGNAGARARLAIHPC